MTDLGQIDPEVVAQWLEAKPGYRVLRKIVERQDFGGTISNPVKVLIVDTETTGLDYEQSEMIEIGLILVEVDANTGEIGKVLGAYGGLEDPGFPIPAESTAIHGITNEMVSGQQFEVNQIQDLCREAQLLVAHNAAFDKPFVVRRFPWLEETVWSCSFKELPYKQEGYSSAKLENLLIECGYFHEAHRAVEDCNALLHFLACPLKESQRQPFELIFASANEPIYEIAALNSPFATKDALRTKGFRWNSDERVWEFTALGFAEGKEVIEWLRTNVYSTTEKIKLGFRIRSGKDRYSKAEVRQQFKEV